MSNNWEEMTHYLDMMFVMAIEQFVKKTNIHPLHPGFVSMLETKVTACVVEVWVRMGRPSKEEWDTLSQPKYYELPGNKLTTKRKTKE